MSKKCRECSEETLAITGAGPYDDTILVECESCGEQYELEPDGLGEGGFELFDALLIEQGRHQAAV